MNPPFPRFRKETVALACAFTLSVSLIGGPSALADATPASAPNPFGSSKKSEAALIGILYDLKQTPDHHPTDVSSDDYSTILQEFFNKGWDEAVLNRYYRVSRPLYTTQIFIPFMSADEAPRAFGAEKTVEPSRWVVHYKAQVAPPEAGTYRFVGASDDLIAVAVNGKTELVANRFDNHMPDLLWKQTEPDGAQASDDALRKGDWVTLKANEIIDLDVVIGERPGGAFNAFLLIEKKGDSYLPDEYGSPVLPIFQVAPYDTPLLAGHRQPPGQETYGGSFNGDGPLFAKSGYPLWKSFQ